MRVTLFVPRGWIVLGLAFIFLTISPAMIVSVWALTDAPQTRATIKGIQAIKVLVERINPEAEKDGLRMDQLQNDVELRLRKAGIVVTPSAEPPAEAVLYVNVSTHKSLNLYAIDFSVNLGQAVMLVRDLKMSTSIIAATWHRGAVGLADRDNLRTYVRDGLADLVDEFINAYLEQNPKR